MIRARPRIHGFSLAELALVLIIISLLLGGVFMPALKQVEVGRIQQTRRVLAQAEEALLNYAARHGGLPCPADPTLPSGNARAGLRQDTCTGAAQGVLPWKELGLPEQDPWGRRYTYWASPVAQICVAPPCFTLATTPAQDVHTSTAGTVRVARDVAAVVISHGHNGLGAYLPSGTQKPSTGASTDELANLTAETALLQQFVSKPQSTDFDDIVDWLAIPRLMNHMIEAERLP